MVTYVFNVYPYSVSTKFTCPSCGKPNRKRTFRAECTVNPFNRKEDGEIRTPSEVCAQSRERALEERRQFLTEPLCASCEGSLSWTEQKSLNMRRRGEADVQPKP